MLFWLENSCSRVLRYHVLVDDDVRLQAPAYSRRPLDFMAAARPAIVSASASAWQRVMARFRDNRLVPFLARRLSFRRGPISICRQLRRSSGARFQQAFSLEALHFLRGSEHTQTSAGVTHGRKIEVTLPDGEVIVGSTLNYRRDGNGFFLHPAQSVFGELACVRHRHRGPARQIPLSKAQCPMLNAQGNRRSRGKSPGGSTSSRSSVQAWHTVSHANISSAAHVTTVHQAPDHAIALRKHDTRFGWELGFGSSGGDSRLDKVARD